MRPYWQLNGVEIQLKFVNVSSATNRPIVAGIYNGLRLLTDFMWTGLSDMKIKVIRP